LGVKQQQKETPKCLAHTNKQNKKIKMTHTIQYTVVLNYMQN